MNKPIFISGGAGLIGLALGKKLLQEGKKVKLFDFSEQFDRRREDLSILTEMFKDKLEIISGTVMDRWSLTTAMSGCDKVVHLAAVLGVRKTEQNRLMCLSVNALGTQNILDAALANSISHIVNASSSEVYGEPSCNPVDELAETKGKTVYAVSKLFGEELIIGYNQVCSSLAYTNIRFFNTYGVGQVAQFVITRFVQKALAGKDILIYGDGNQLRSYCYVDDAVDGIGLILDSKKALNQVYNIGNSSEVYTLNQLASLVVSTLQLENRVQIRNIPFSDSDRDERREIFTRHCDTSKIEKELGYSPSIQVSEGIQRIAQTSIDTNWC